VEARNVFDRGSHRPLVITAEDEETGEPCEWVLKLQHNDNVAENHPKLSVVRELAGAEVCALLGVRTPAIGLLRVPSDAAALAVREEVRDQLRLNLGEILFCSRLVPHATDWPVAAEQGADARAALQASALALLYLDVFLLHDDRTVDRPNALLANGGLWAIDHGNIVAKLHSDSSVHGVVAPTRIRTRTRPGLRNWTRRRESPTSP
jgi:hypothetical protein